MSDSKADAALLKLLGWLDQAGYDFVTPAPSTHRRVLRRDGDALACGVRDVLGWSRAFPPGAIPSDLFDLLEAAGMLSREGERWRSRIRVSRVRGRLFLHSAYPTRDKDAVFLGPDSYRFADLIARELPRAPVGPILDVGGGAGVGAVIAADLSGAETVMTDVNPRALRFAQLNAAHAGAKVSVREGSGLEPAPKRLGVVIANPPYIAQTDKTYSDGGDLLGGALSVDWARSALQRLAPGGKLILYTGSAIRRGGRDVLREALADVARTARATMDYAELDPDVFGAELSRPAYAEAERIAVVACLMSAR